MKTRDLNSRKWLGAACLAGLLCLPAFADTPADGSTHKKTGQSSTTAKKASTTHSTSTTSHNSASTHKTSQSTGASSHHGKKTRSASSRHGQQKIDGDRTRQIQEALIRQHYLQGEPSGKWDPQTEEALRKMQADNGWQNKTVPDSRALIKLGLGPNQDHLLNPESAMTTSSEAARATPPATSSVPTTAPVSQRQ